LLTDPKVVTATKVAPTVTTGRFKPTVDPKTGAVTDRLGNPVVTDAKGWGYFDAKTGLAVTPATDQINGGGKGFAGAAFGLGGGAALDTNKDNYISEAEIAAGKSKRFRVRAKRMVTIRYWVRYNPTRFGYKPNRSCWSC
jgi:hypothetical protein